jgi:hypothetical protein|tara:strand:- start:1909 stop:2079 length:171 start_codon:yes stop_codon:yes gene_type:complete
MDINFGAEGDGDSWSNYGKPHQTKYKQGFCPKCDEYGYVEQIGCYSCEYKSDEGEK